MSASEQTKHFAPFVPLEPNAKRLVGRYIFHGGGMGGDYDGPWETIRVRLFKGKTFGAELAAGGGGLSGGGLTISGHWTYDPAPAVAVTNKPNKCKSKTKKGKRHAKKNDVAATAAALAETGIRKDEPELAITTYDTSTWGEEKDAEEDVLGRMGPTGEKINIFVTCDSSWQNEDFECAERTAPMFTLFVLGNADNTMLLMNEDTILKNEAAHTCVPRKW